MRISKCSAFSAGRFFRMKASAYGNFHDLQGQEMCIFNTISLQIFTVNDGYDTF